MEGQFFLVFVFYMNTGCPLIIKSFDSVVANILNVVIQTEFFFGKREFYVSSRIFKR